MSTCRWKSGGGVCIAVVHTPARRWRRSGRTNHHVNRLRKRDHVLPRSRIGVGAPPDRREFRVVLAPHRSLPLYPLGMRPPAKAPHRPPPCVTFHANGDASEPTPPFGWSASPHRSFPSRIGRDHPGIAPERGNAMVNRQPVPTFSAPIRPRCASTMPRAIARPKPAPPSGSGVRAGAPR